MPRFFVPREQMGDSERVIIKGKEVRHIARVLRLREGERIEIFDGKGREYLVLLKKVAREKVEGDIIKELKVNREPRVQVTLAQSLPKIDKMDWVVRKCVELGVSRIIPLLSERTIVKLEERKASERCRRWQRIAEQSCRQCGRSKVIPVERIRSFKEILEEENGVDLALIPWERGKIKIKNALKEKRKPRKILVLIGPEGGFSEEEVRGAEAKGIIPVTLGPRILRTETAGLATLAIILYELE
ncbi:Ribosomal RNA small subunit methyltransferase E [subsurface metagenome]